MQKCEIKGVRTGITADSVMRSCSGKCPPAIEHCQDCSTEVHQALNTLQSQ